MDLGDHPKKKYVNTKPCLDEYAYKERCNNKNFVKLYNITKILNLKVISRGEKKGEFLPLWIIIAFESNLRACIFSLSRSAHIAPYRSLPHHRNIRNGNHMDCKDHKLHNIHDK